MCLSPKKVKTTPVSTPEIELYRREHASGIVVTDAVITFPNSYGKDIYTDGSDEDAELSAMRITLRYGREAGFPFNSPQPLRSGGGLTFTEVDGGLNPKIWYKPSEKGKKIMLTFEDSFYTQGTDVILEVGFKNEGMDTYEIAQKNFGKSTPDTGDGALTGDYIVVNDMKIDGSILAINLEPLDDCMARCTSLSSCTQFDRSPGGYCRFFGQTAVPKEATGYTTYKKVAGGGSPS